MFPIFKGDPNGLPRITALGSEFPMLVDLGTDGTAVPAGYAVSRAWRGDGVPVAGFAFAYDATAVDSTTGGFVLDAAGLTAGTTYFVEYDVPATIAPAAADNTETILAPSAPARQSTLEPVFPASGDASDSQNKPRFVTTP